MTTVGDRREDRRAFLIAAYEAVDGSQFSRTNVKKLAPLLGMNEQQAVDALAWWRGRECIGNETLGGGFGLSSKGLEEAERLIDEGAVIPAAFLTMTPDELEAVERFLTELRRTDVLDRLDAEGGADAASQVATVEAQMRSPRPRRRIVRAALRELHGLLSGAAGNLVYELLRAAVRELGGP